MCVCACAPPRWPSGKVSASRVEGSEFESRLCRIFSGLSHTSDLNIGTPVTTLPGAWHYRVSTGTGQPGVSILWLGEMESLICSFYLSVAARKIVCADPSLWDTLACCWDVKQPTNKQTCACAFGRGWGKIAVRLYMMAVTLLYKQKNSKRARTIWCKRYTHSILNRKTLTSISFRDRNQKLNTCTSYKN